MDECLYSAMDIFHQYTWVHPTTSLLSVVLRASFSYRTVQTMLINNFKKNQDGFCLLFARLYYDLNSRENLDSPAGEGAECPRHEISGGIEGVAAVETVRHSDDGDDDADAEGRRTGGSGLVLVVGDRHDAQHQQHRSEHLPAVANVFL